MFCLQSKVTRYLILTFACLISASAINLFLVPHQLLSGGIGGIAIILYYLFGLPIGTMTLIMNIPLLFAAYRLLGKPYTMDVIFGTVVFSVAIDAMMFLQNFPIVDDSLLAAIYGGVFTGIGYGIVFRFNGSTGGFDIVAAIVKKYYALNMGAVNFSLNCIIMLVAAGFFGPKLAMLTLISMFVAAKLTDKVVAGFNNKKTVMIISSKSEKIADEIIKEVGRGVTFLKGEGAFTHQHKDIIFVVVNLTQIGKIKLLVDLLDPMAFMIVQDANEVMGRGFTLPGTQIEEMIKLKNSAVRK